MIVCTHCETAQFLQITDSRMQFRDGDVHDVFERYQCTRCDSEGQYSYVDEDEFVVGAIEILDDRPRMSRL